MGGQSILDVANGQIKVGIRRAKVHNHAYGLCKFLTGNRKVRPKFLLPFSGYQLRFTFNGQKDSRERLL